MPAAAGSRAGSGHRGSLGFPCRPWGSIARGSIGTVVTVLALSACLENDIGAPPEGTVFVNIGDNFFQPDTVRVPLSRSVRWTNLGGVLHSVVSDSQLWQSDTIPRTFWFEKRFDESGTFDYHCSLHSEKG